MKLQAELNPEVDETSTPPSSNQSARHSTELRPIVNDDSLETLEEEDDVASQLDEVGVCSFQFFSCKHMFCCYLQLRECCLS